MTGLVQRFSIRRNINFAGGFVRPLETYTYRQGKEVGSVVDFLHDNILKTEVKTNKSSAFPETSLTKRGSVLARVRKTGSKMIVTVQSQDFQYSAMIIMKLVALYFTLIFNFFSFGEYKPNFVSLKKYLFDSKVNL